jgi:hypothetical protein
MHLRELTLGARKDSSAKTVITVEVTDDRINSSGLWAPGFLDIGVCNFCL